MGLVLAMANAEQERLAAAINVIGNKELVEVSQEVFASMHAHGFLEWQHCSLNISGDQSM